MIIEKICDQLIVAMEDAGYNDSTIFNYRGVIRRFKEFCEKEGVKEYDQDIGQKYADNVISTVTGKFSTQRYHSQHRFIRLLNSYYINGEFDFKTMKRGKQTPNDPVARAIYDKYCAFLAETYENRNTIHFYEYGMYSLLHYLCYAEFGIVRTKDLSIPLLLFAKRSRNATPFNLSPRKAILMIMHVVKVSFDI